jgi:hypothetical protein
MHDMGEYGASRPDFAPTSSPSRERLLYLRHLRAIHAEDEFRLARADMLQAPSEDVERLLFEAEMLANYDVPEDG